MEQFIKNEIEKYKSLKKVYEILMDADHPLHNDISKMLTLDQVLQLTLYINERKDEGMDLLAYPKN